MPAYPRQPLASSALALVLLAALAQACQGEQGQKGDPGAPTLTGLPVLSNITLAPTSAVQGAGGGTVTVRFAVDVADDSADVNGFSALVVDPASAPGVAHVSSSAQTVAPGETSMTLSGRLDVFTATAGPLTVYFEATDAAGHRTTVHALFTVEPRRPVLDAISPASAGMAAAPLALTVTGSGFDEGSTVYWSGLALPTTRVDAGTLHATVAIGQLYAPGAWPVWVRDAGGQLSGALFFQVVESPPPPPPPPPAAPTLTSISPTHVEQGSGNVTLTATGSGFDATTALYFGGTWLSTALVDATHVEALVSSYLLTATGSVQVTARNGMSGPSAAIDFTVEPPAPRPAPVLTGLSPAFADAGSGDLQVTLTGSGFHASSRIIVNGFYYYYATTFVSETELRVTLPASSLASPGTLNLSLETSPPGGGTSASLGFVVGLPAIPGLTTVRLAARDLVWDPYGQRLYLSVGSGSALNPNSVVVLDPFTGAVEGSVLAGSEPGPLALADDGRLLYVGHLGASEVIRYTVPALVEDLTIPLGREATYGAYTATGLAVAPGAPRTVAVALTAGYAQATALFDDATPRADRGGPANALTFGADASRVYLLGTYYAGDLSVVPLSSTGLGAATVYRSAFALTSALKYDPGTGLLYGADGRAVDPATGALAGTFSPGAYYTNQVAPDSSLGTAFFAGTTGYSSWLTVQAFDIDRYVARGTTELRYRSGTVTRLVRWGPDGLAILTSDRVELLRGPAVLPLATSDNPAPTVASLSPASVAAGRGNLRLTVTGGGFVPGSVVRVGGSDRFTHRVSATELTAYVPAIALAAAGDLAVAVVNPAPGGGTSATATLTVGP